MVPLEAACAGLCHGAGEARRLWLMLHLLLLGRKQSRQWALWFDSVRAMANSRVRLLRCSCPSPKLHCTQSQKLGSELLILLRAAQRGARSLRVGIIADHSTGEGEVRLPSHPSLPAEGGCSLRDLKAKSEQKPLTLAPPAGGRLRFSIPSQQWTSAYSKSPLTRKHQAPLPRPQTNSLHYGVSFVS
jgi:hypothetical protein